MTEQSNTEDQDKTKKPIPTVKVVAEMPEDAEMRDKLQEMKENDGHPESCGGI